MLRKLYYRRLDILRLGRLPADPKVPTIKLVESIQLDSIIDNPSYFADPFASKACDMSGYILLGLARAVDLGKTKQDPKAAEPVMVWYARPVGGEAGQEGSNR